MYVILSYLQTNCGVFENNNFIYVDTGTVSSNFSGPGGGGVGVLWGPEFKESSCILLLYNFHQIERGISD